LQLNGKAFGTVLDLVKIGSKIQVGQEIKLEVEFQSTEAHFLMLLTGTGDDGKVLLRKSQHMYGDELLKEEV
jgi:hypothetical protein